MIITTGFENGTADTTYTMMFHDFGKNRSLSFFIIHCNRFTNISNLIYLSSNRTNWMKNFFNKLQYKKITIEFNFYREKQLETAIILNPLTENSCNVY